MDAELILSQMILIGIRIQGEPRVVIRLSAHLESLIGIICESINLASMWRCQQLLHDLVNSETGSFLARWELLESFQEVSDISLRRYQQKSMVHPPIPVGVRGDGRPLIRIRAQVEQPGYPRIHQGFSPDQHGALCPLLGKYDLPVIVTERLQIAIVGEVEELLARALLLLACQVGQEVIAI